MASTEGVKGFAHISLSGVIEMIVGLTILTVRRPSSKLGEVNIVARHLDTADDLFGGPQGNPRTDKMIAAAIQWAERIMGKIDNVFE